MGILDIVSCGCPRSIHKKPCSRVPIKQSCRNRLKLFTLYSVSRRLVSNVRNEKHTLHTMTTKTPKTVMSLSLPETESPAPMQIGKSDKTCLRVVGSACGSKHRPSKYVAMGSAARNVMTVDTCSMLILALRVTKPAQNTIVSKKVHGAAFLVGKS